MHAVLVGFSYINFG